MKVALVQFDIAWEEKNENIARIECLLKNNDLNQVDLIVFPEMTLTGFSMNVAQTGESDEKSLSFFKKIAKLYNTAVVFGWVEERNKSYYNVCSCISKNGEELTRYAKMHTFSYADENAFIASGMMIKHFIINTTNCSVFICYDLRFPEVFQIASKSSDLIVVIANWPKNRIEHWTSLLKARAIENQIFIIGVNRIGIGNNIEYSGNTMIFNPMGKSILDTFSKEGVFICTLESDMAKEVRLKYPFKKDRKENLYSEYYSMEKQ